MLNVFNKSIRKIERLLCNLEDLIYEIRYSFDLNGVIEKKDLHPLKGWSSIHANACQAVWSKTLRELMTESIKGGLQYQNFIDIGSGKGKACLYAHLNFNFKNIIGVEFSKNLVDIAYKNKSKIKSSNIIFLHMDALDYVLPNQSCFIFMFNPFGSAVLESFIQNNIDHFKKYKSVVAYANDVERATLLGLGFSMVYRNNNTKNSLFEFNLDA